ncbi:MAG: 30S ribosome-binding factor RbfA [Alphaproteobacteria bacterium]|jgi:ribosome-binding factor A|nr:30S ribosome-binding factor RbfA [Alphaproteobacteria bacterium]MDP6238517.1 30S ribosome-binding factor RbfA [Alphaproteobacteria bacterium]MDP7173056.1 30S ribosome-binding factor RbfA [Alphaproteobacteria bacterium]MDP7233503.1 30S ribosome-binding factor RbfA [Alphaproteobacteria bacterium]MDP7487522.1 30S ribosome-binding factor RbfA [Alphaproteobacteria bacterium]|tara:strand:- start:347 stop:736 length:390 start_codon:yes stop_codon:yes gene_type:complete
MARKRGKGRGPSQRQLRVGESLRHALAELLGRRELRDPALVDVSITVTEVQVSLDMRKATVYVLPLGAEDVETVLEGLGRAAPYLGSQVARLMKLKYSPRLSFIAETSFDRAARIDAVIDGSLADDDKR